MKKVHNIHVTLCYTYVMHFCALLHFLDDVALVISFQKEAQ